MSLVNDMLRDLDQRRKESEGPAARIRLTPAGDYPRQERRNWVPLIAIGLVIAAGGLGYVWLQMEQGSSTVQVARTVTPVVPSTVPEEPDEDGEAEVTSPDLIVSDNEPAVVATPAAAEVESALDEVLSGSDLQQQLNALAELQPAIETPTAAGGNVPEAPAPTAVHESHSRETPLTASTVSTGAASRTNLTNVIPEQVKDVTAPTPEQRDTLVVQEALRLLANNQATAAYTQLEQHLLNNPYAHQTRETYAKFLMNEGDAQSAYSLVNAGLELAPNHSGFKKVKARLLIGEGEIKEAVELLQSRAPLVSNDLEYHEILASAQLASRDYSGAALSYTSLVQQDQNQGRWWYGFAAAQDALGNTTAARQAYTRALEKQNLSTNLRRRSQDRLTALSR